MNIITTITVLILSIFLSINSRQTETIIIEKSEIKNGFTIKDQEYTLYFEIENFENQNPILVISIELNNGSYFISPKAKRDFKGKFYVDLGSNTDLDFEGDIIEIPQSNEEFDPHPFVNGSVNWVHENTIYKQPLKLKSQKDFEVFGRLRFTIEPRCTLEEIPFAISYKNGVMKFIDPKC